MPQPAPDQDTPDRTEAVVLDLLVGSDGHLWSVAEVGCEVGSELKAADTLEALHRAGLIHRTSDGFVFATRAAIRESELRL